MIVVTMQVADLSLVMGWTWLSRLSSCFGAKSIRERQPKWLSGLVWSVCELRGHMGQFCC